MHEAGSAGVPRRVRCRNSSEGFAERLRVPDGAREIQVFDDELPGFGIRKFESGKASYFVKYRVGPKQRRLTLGKVTRDNLTDMRPEASKGPGEGAPRNRRGRH